MLHLVLYHPAIPQNTGNIARTTVGMNAHLHLIHPMKFEISDHAVKRAGLDYWPNVRLTEHTDEGAFLDWLGEREPWLVTKHGARRFDAPPYADGDVIVLGNENTGLPRRGTSGGGSGRCISRCRGGSAATTWRTRRRSCWRRRRCGLPMGVVDVGCANRKRWG